MPKFIDLTGKKFGKLVVIGISNRINGKIIWKCQCECGKITIVAGANLKNGHTSSCGCLRHDIPSNSVDLIGKKFGRLTVIERDKPHITSGGASISRWICRCDCGNIKSVQSQKLRKGTTVSCGCYRDDNMKKLNFDDLSGQRFGRLTVVRYLEEKERKTIGYNWLCKCDCGKYIHKNASKLKNGHSKSCGCLVAEHIGNVNRKYAIVNKRLYGIYQSMVSRCCDWGNKRYKDYGGRGIRVCDEWLGEYGYESFSIWAYSSGYDENAKRGQCTLDRENVDGNYSPKNCRWITNKKQQNNRRDCRYIEHDNKKQTIAEWADELGITYAKAYWHLGKKNRTIQELIDNYLD